jgi:hypothetical protein
MWPAREKVQPALAVIFLWEMETNATVTFRRSRGQSRTPQQAPNVDFPSLLRDREIGPDRDLLAVSASSAGPYARTMASDLRERVTNLLTIRVDLMD